MSWRIFAELFRELEVAKPIVAENPVASSPNKTEHTDKSNPGRAGEDWVYPDGKSHRWMRERACEPCKKALPGRSVAWRLLDSFRQLAAFEATAEILDGFRDAFFKFHLRFPAENFPRPGDIRLPHL